MTVASGGAPYRELVVGAAAGPAGELARVDVSGARGADGAAGADGADGGRGGVLLAASDGQRGGDAGAAVAGEDAGSIAVTLAFADGTFTLRGERRRPDGGVAAVEHAGFVGERGAIALRAVGGAGGRGGDGGAGGAGGRGRDGADATRHGSGGDGGDGGAGGAGGDATSGGAGGRGGAIVVRVAADATAALMLIDHAVAGGAGGAPGVNGRGGQGGVGGRGGSSYSWTETDSSTDANGQTRIDTTHHSNPAGRDGHDGAAGRGGDARVQRGADAAPGQLTIEVDDGGVYASRYDLRLRGFRHVDGSGDGTYEPGDQVRVTGLEVVNVGGMPTPTTSPLTLALAQTDWLAPADGHLVCPPGLPADAVARVDGELIATIRDHTPTEPGEPLAASTTIVHRAELPEVRRGFDDYQDASARALGAIVIRHPVTLSAPRHLRSLAPGEATRVRLTVTNRSTVALGAGAAAPRALQVRIARADDAGLAGRHATITGDGRSGAATEAWVLPIDLLAPGEAREVEAELRVTADAPEYQALTLTIALELGPLADPATPRPVQLRAVTVRVARAFVTEDADVVLVVSHQTSAEDVARWEATAHGVMARLALWDVSREGHLDLERPLAGGGTLAELFAGKAIVILDRPFDGPGGPISPRDLLDPDQALRAAATGLDLALIGDGPGLRDLLTPSPTATGTATDVADDRAAALGVVARGRRALVPVFRRFPLLRWRRPTAAWLSAQAERLSAALAQALPTQRHLVIHRFEPERVAGGWRGALWRVGTLETVRTLDADAGAMVHAAGTPSTGEATLAMLVALDFDQQLERLRWTLADPGATLGALTAIVDALVIDVASELEVINRPGRRRGASADDLAAALPRLHALGHGVGTTALDTPGGVAVVDLASRIASFAASQVDWLDRLPPWRWWRRAPATARLATAALEALVASVFAPDEQAAARAAIAARVAAHRQAYRVARRGLGGAGRRAYGLRAALAPLASDVVTADIELLTSAAERVVTGDAYDDVLAEREAAAARRARVVDALAAERAALGA